MQQQPQRQRNETDGVVLAKWVLFLPAGTVVDAGDQIIVENQAFEVDGVPWEVRNPRTQTVSHIEATLLYTEGVGGS